MKEKFLINADGLLFQYLNMINDQYRNQFYDRMLERNLKGGKVLDVGFGTGFLTLLALKNKAIKVHAFEQQIGLYEFGKELLNQLDYESKVKLELGRFYAEGINEEYECLIHEVMGENIWSEYLFYIIKSLTIPVFPNVYRLDLKAYPLNDFYDDKNKYDNSFYDSLKFSPGVFFDPKVHVTKEQLLNARLNSFCQKELKTTCLDPKYMPAEDLMSPLGHYQLDHNKKTLEISDLKGIVKKDYQVLPQYLELSFKFSKSGFYALWLDFQFGDNREIFSTTKKYPNKNWDTYDRGGNPIVIYADKDKEYVFSQDISNGRYLFLKQ